MSVNSFSFAPQSAFGLSRANRDRYSKGVPPTMGGHPNTFVKLRCNLAYDLTQRIFTGYLKIPLINPVV